MNNNFDDTNDENNPNIGNLGGNVGSSGVNPRNPGPIRGNLGDTGNNTNNLHDFGSEPGSSVVNPGDAVDDTPLMSSNGYSAKDCVAAIDEIEDLIAGPFADPRFDMTGNLQFSRLNDVLNYERKDVRHDR